jgi:hypothetical protein
VGDRRLSTSSPWSWGVPSDLRVQLGTVPAEWPVRHLQADRFRIPGLRLDAGHTTVATFLIARTVTISVRVRSCPTRSRTQAFDVIGAESLELMPVVVGLIHGAVDDDRCPPLPGAAPVFPLER